MEQGIVTPDTRSATLYKRLIRQYVLRYRAVLALAALGMVIVAGSTAGNAALMKPVLDDIFVRKDETWLMLLPMAIILLAFLNALGDYMQSVALKYVGQRVVADMQTDLFAHVLQADITLYHDQSSGRLISRLTNDLMLIRQSVSQVLTGAIKEFLTMIFLVGWVFYLDWRLTCVALLVLVFAVLPIARLGRRMRKVADATQSQLGDFTAQLDDIFQGVRVVKAYAREEQEAARARQTIHRLFRLYYKAAKVQSAPGPIMGLLGGGAIAAVIWYGGSSAMHDQHSAGTFTSFIVSMVMAYRPSKVLAGLNTQLQEGMAAAARFYAVLDTRPTIHDRPGAARLAVTHGAVQFEDVNFRYHAGSGGVEGLSFTVPAGRTVALVGASGSGKTTIMNLLLRFYEVQEGRICIDGQDIRAVQLASLREQLAFVSQEVILFNDTVRANIAYGRTGADAEAIIDAARQAHAHDFIMQLPQGYDTPIGPLGVKLSGGQRQRLSIARAILKNAPILLLDEATSALDTASERAVQEALTSLMQGRTTLVIAHRLSTIRHADRILVLDRGHIRAQGTHEELLQQSAIYRHMQQLHTAEEPA